MTDLLGWAAAETFTLSYFCRSKSRILLVQIVAASLWLGYGVVLRSPPMVIANVAVVLAAGSALVRGR